MASLSVVCNHGSLSFRHNFVVSRVKTRSLSTYTSVCSLRLSSSATGFQSLTNGIDRIPVLGFTRVCGKSRCVVRIRSSNEIRSLMNGDEAHLGKRGKSRRFSLRLRPRLRLLTIRMKKVSFRSIMDGFRMFLMNNIKRLGLFGAVSIAFTLCYLLLRVTAVPSPKVVSYSELITSLHADSVTKVLIEEGSRRIYFNTNSRESSQSVEEKLPEDVYVADTVDDNEDREMKIKKYLGGAKSSKPEWEFSTRKMERDEKFLLNLMREKGTSYGSAPQSILLSMRNILVTIISLWIPLTPFMWLLYRQLSTANSPAKKRQSNNQMVGFDDVEGVDGAKLELMEIVSCLQGTINYKKLGAKLPRGVLLVGPPGTGKTLLARAVAGEAGVPFFSVSASEFVEMFVGRGAARIRELFNVAKKCAPSIIFIDELDAVGGKRGRSLNDERDQTLNQLLTEMDGFESNIKVVVIAATNRPEALDAALCRPGRFSRKVFVGEPDEEGRRKILAVHLREVPLEEDMELICDLVASLTPGFVGADLANIINEAALLAARRGGERVIREDVMEAIERAKFGINDKQMRPSRISKELEKLFPWMQTLKGKQNGSQGPLGYQTLS